MGRVMEPVTIYEELIDLIEQAEQADDSRHPVEALIALGNARNRITSYLDGQAN